MNFYRTSNWESFYNRLFKHHGARLPQNRGGIFSWQILMGNRVGYCKIHLVNAGADNGDWSDLRSLYPPKCRLPKDYEQL